MVWINAEADPVPSLECWWGSHGDATGFWTRSNGGPSRTALQTMLPNMARTI